MAEVINDRSVLSDSNTKPRPNFQTYMVTDSNARGHAVHQIEEKRRLRHMKFPSLKGRHDVDSFQENVDSNVGFKRWNDEGEYHANAPYRTYDNTVDPTSGFVSAGGDVDRQTGHTQIRSLVQLNKTPQAMTPRGQNTVRKEPAAPPELKREATWSPGVPTQWNSRKTSDIWMRSKLGGWTSDVDPRVTSAGRPQTSPEEQTRSSRDKLALKYMYGTSTQRGYEEVPWDHFLAPKMWPPTVTTEEKPDNISHRWHNKRYDPAAQEWQAVGRGLDWFLPRKGYYKDESVTFCSPCHRTQQIPLYSGCIGAENLVELDNAKEPFHPYTVKRSAIPRPSETAHRPNIPLYSGCTLWQGYYAPAHSKPADREYLQPTTTTFHKSIPVEQTPVDHKRNAQMSKMITLVPPCNPFNSMEKEGVQV
ncbi:spermatogenesis-associated protein 48 [Aplysia californica]|uniref:Spermatogenesis-associated protein 48 n=1 Tax=Aplysia californica TaxID=6500 RepID=A0ABM0K6J7_APLCA|nr:spermatogenesis-associated protein 48 [Aplysia californica]